MTQGPSVPTSWYFEDLVPGRRIRHARSATVGEVEGSWMAKLVMNTAQAHWNEHYLTDSPLGSGRVVFGLLTASMVVGLAGQDTADNALHEVGLDGLRFTAPVHHGDTLTAFTEVVAADPHPERDDVGVVRFRHWGLNQHDVVVFEGERTTVVKRRSHWGAP
ncbi:MAG TPA: MaoC family dehydratase [Acidimicrobiales bacterium]|nr:MaoC family dehydratase [Acidimicrobiales bacterium]